MGTLSFKQVIEHCRKNKCDAFALNDKKQEIFIVEYHDDDGDIDEITMFYQCDFNGMGVEDNVDIVNALAEFPYLEDLVFHTFNSENAEWYNCEYSYAKESLLKAIN